MEKEQWCEREEQKLKISIGGLNRGNTIKF